MTPRLDRLFTGGILFLILLTPFTFGTVQPWAYTAMEVIIFALVIVWILKSAILARRHGAWSTEQGASKSAFRNSKFEMLALGLPLALFALLGLFQLVPLPPELLKTISPQTFEVYKQSLPGWPERVPYAELASMEQRARSEALGTGDGGQTTDIGHQSSVSGQRDTAPDATNADPNTENPTPNTEDPITNTQHPTPNTPAPTWLPLSISAGLTKIDLLKFTAFAALFFLVWRYPFEEEFEDFGFRSSDLGFSVLSPEQRFLRSLFIAIIATGLLVAAFGFIERFAWNGDILLFVAGYESGAPASNTVARASGPFINPDHFANYLALIFPLALGCALFRTFMVSKSQQYGMKIFCGFTTFLLFTGILLSLSRGAWISTLLGIAIFAWLAPWQGAGSRERGAKGREHRARSRERSLTPNTHDPRPETGDWRLETGRSRNSRSAPSSMLQAPSSKLARMARLSLVTVCILLIVSLFFAGQSGREQVDLRLIETVEQTDLGLGARVSVILKDIPKMIMDFPLFGVGLGAWPELFLRYRSGPWSGNFFREAHNDYLEVLAETGFIGFGLLTAFFFLAGKRLVHGLRRASSKHLPLIAGILAALGGMALHEWLDFSLQIPANAFLFTVLLAIGMRLTASREQGAARQFEFRNSDFEMSSEPSGGTIIPDWSDVQSEKIRDPKSRIQNSFSMLHALSSMRAAVARLRSPVAAVSISLLALIALVCSLRQDQSSYPYNFKEMTSVVEAKELLLKHPTHSPYHLSVVRLAGESAPLGWQLTQAKAALWNEPANPYYRDFYAATLIAMGKTEEGLKEVARSVAESPSLSTHAYLSPENLPLLTGEEQAAVENGFKQALARSYPEAANGLADFYAKLHRFADQAALYEEAALKENDSTKKTALLINAGLAYLKDVRGEASGERGDSKNATNTQHNNATHATSEGLGVSGNTTNAINARDAQRANAINAASATNAPDASRLTPHGVSAERAFRAAVAANPSDPKPYQKLVTTIHASRKDLDGARELVANGIKSGAPALPLYLSLAEAAHKVDDPEESKEALDSAKAEVDKLIKKGESPHRVYMTLADGARSAGDREQESAALLKALERQPRSPETLMRLATVYSEKQNYDRAAMYLNRVAGISPNSADLYYRIAQTEEARYHFAAAGRAYAKALELAPENADYRQSYESFRERVARSREVTFDKSP